MHRNLRRPGVLALLAVTSVSVTSCAGAGTVHPSAPTTGAGGTTQTVAHGPAPTDNGAHPNVLMITVDDAAPENLRFMPNVRRLIAREGVNLSNGVAPTPICVPARASLLTGQYAHNHGAHSISGPQSGFTSFADTETLPVWLRRAGYDTIFIGKYLNGYGANYASRTYVPPGWSEWRATVGPSTYNYARPTLNVDGRPRTVREYSSDLFSDYTVDLLSQERRTTRPWFMMVNYVAPHSGGPAEPDDPKVEHPHAQAIPTPHVDPRHRDEFADLPLPGTPDMFEKDTSDKARVSHTSQHWTRLGRAMLTEENQQRVESLQAVDEGVARAVHTLRRTGQLRNTVITFSSDNGFLVGQHNRYGKLIHYEQSLRVPMLLRGPGIPRHRTVGTQVTNPDLATTVAAIAGAMPTCPQDGVDIRPLLTEGDRARVVPIEAWRPHDGSRLEYRGVRTESWTYVRFFDGEEELYDRRRDPYELTSLAKSPRYTAALHRMRALTRRYEDCAGRSCQALRGG